MAIGNPGRTRSANSAVRCSANKPLEQSNSDWLRLVRSRQLTRKQKKDLVVSQPRSSWRLDQLRVAPSKVDEDIRWLEHPDHHMITLHDDRYPNLLREIADPPIVLFAIGNVDLLSAFNIAVVGSRRASPAGLRMTEKLVTEMVAVGLTPVSGIALGVDAAAHRAALLAGAASIAVMAHGLHMVSPVRHRRLFDDIAKQGVVITEYPLHTAPTKYTFPERNRIVSGLSLGALIVEAAERSGTGITARLALEQNREVFVVPGSPLNRQYTHSLELLKQGATLTTSAEDILFSLQLPLSDATHKPPMQADITADAEVDYPILRHIDYDATPIETIIQTSGLTAAEVSSMLIMLEVQGFIAGSNIRGYYKTI